MVSAITALTVKLGANNCKVRPAPYPSIVHCVIHVLESHKTDSCRLLPYRRETLPLKGILQGIGRANPTGDASVSGERRLLRLTAARRLA